MTFQDDGKIYIKLDARGDTNSSDRRWDDGVQGQVKQILLWHDNSGISGFQTIYESRGAKLISKRHGGTQGNFEMINPKKPLTWLSGHYGSYCINPELFVNEEEDPRKYNKVITSLKFGNEEETYGPFGHAEGTSFFFRTSAEIVGFHGSSSDADKFGFITAIGLYIKTEAVDVIGVPSRMIEYGNKLKLISGK